MRIQVDFPMLGDADDAPLRSCRVEAWDPPPLSGLSGGDVAGLVLVGEGLPHGAGSARLTVRDYRGMSLLMCSAARLGGRRELGRCSGCGVR